MFQRFRVFPHCSKYSFVAEVRSLPEQGARAASACMIRLLERQSGRLQQRTLRVTLPYIRQDIPVVIVFRALGYVSDREVLEHIVYDFNDVSMMDLMRPSLEEAFVIQSQEVALDFIGKRGNVVGASREARIKYARDLLQKARATSIGLSPPRP